MLGTMSQPMKSAEDRRRDFERHRRSMTTLRWAMIAVGVVGGALLFLAGAQVIGAIIAALAIVRGVLFLSMSRKREAWIRDNGVGAGGRRPMRGPGRESS